MLVFTRKSGQSLMIGDHIEIKILSVGPGHVSIGIGAPRQIPVHRTEIYQEIVRQNQLASRSKLPSRDLLEKLQESGKSAFRRRRDSGHK